MNGHWYDVIRWALCVGVGFSIGSAIVGAVLGLVAALRMKR